MVAGDDDRINVSELQRQLMDLVQSFEVEGRQDPILRCMRDEMKSYHDQLDTMKADSNGVYRTGAGISISSSLVEDITELCTSRAAYAFYIVFP